MFPFSNCWLSCYSCYTGRKLRIRKTPQFVWGPRKDWSEGSDRWHKPVHLVCPRIIAHSVEALAPLGCNFYFLILSWDFVFVHGPSAADFTERSGGAAGMVREQMECSKVRDAVAPEPALPSLCVTWKKLKLETNYGCWSFILIFKFILLHWDINCGAVPPTESSDLITSLFHKQGVTKEQKLCETPVKFKCPIPFNLGVLSLLLFLADTNSWSHVISLIWII